MAKITNEDFVRKAKIIHGEKYDYSKVEYVKSKKEVCIICPTHGEFWQTPNDHLNGSGCKSCGIELRNKKNRTTRIEFIEKAKKIHGNRYDYSLITDENYIDTKHDVQIICPTHGAFSLTPNEHLCGRGCRTCGIQRRNEKRKGKCRMETRTGVLGVGINDFFGSNAGLLSYKKWYNMLVRCYSKKYHKQKPTYSECKVCEEWLRFSNFKDWFDKHYVEGYVLDKDILVKGNKIYSPETCCFIPASLNSLLTKRDNCRGKYPIGVQRTKYGKYLSSMNINGTSAVIGRYGSIEEAFYAYKKEKEKHIKQVAQEYYDTGKINKNVYDALINYRVEITD